MKTSPISFATCVFVGICLCWLSPAAEARFKPECVAWDQLIRTISRNARAIPTASAKCSRSADCTRFACKFLMLRKDIIFDVKLLPCATPAQMRLLVLSNTDNVYFEQTVMHGNTYPVPGLTYNLFPGMRLQISVQVHFKKVTAGLEIGLRLKFSGPTPLITFSYPIFPDYVIPVRDCTAAVTPTQMHCAQMNKTITGLTLPQSHLCTMVKGCGGFNCNGLIPSGQSSTANPIKYGVSLVMNGCDSPLSYSLGIRSASGSWQYKFFRSKEVFVNLTFPHQTVLHANLIMTPDINLETMTTSLALRSCAGREPCLNTTILDQTEVPIPPCSSTVPTGSTPTVATTPQADECQVWKRVENELIQSAGPGYGITSCTTIENCSGYDCTGEFEGHNYTIVTVLRHCANPVVLSMTVRSKTDRFFWKKAVTHNDNITVAGRAKGTHGMLGFHIHLLKLSARQVLIGVYAKVGLPGLSPLSVPLIKDQIMPVSRCRVPPWRGPGGGGRAGGNNGRGGANERGRPDHPNKPRPTKSPVQNMKSRTGVSVGIGLTIGIGIASLVAAVMIYVYYKQFPSPDRVILVHRTAPPTTARTL
ncbi:uncharacterized protein [Diadema antillarum]|uniref:uncharacterized protein n=1 Tax=Diadema antillarum TaxID=105358 RepID=UPI003A84ACFD